MIKDFKDTEPANVDWAKSFVAIFTELHDYVKRNHTTGLVWNAKGETLTSVPAAKPAAPAAAAKPAVAAPAPAAAAAPVAAKPALFSELSKGTAGLKHVDKSQMTHKNPELRTSSVVAATAPSAPAVPKAEASAKDVVKPPVTELQGNKWVVVSLCAG